jgi:glycyl-tRNA synthetase (class II)
MSVANKGSYDLEAHVNSAKHKEQIQSCHNTPKVSEFFIKQNSKTEERVVATEGELSFLAVKHHLPCRSMDCTSKLNQVLYSDLETAKKSFRCKNKSRSHWK